MISLRGLGACLMALAVTGCAPYGYNDHYSDYYDYYGGYPYAGNTYLSYHGGYPYYYRPWYDYPPWYWYDRDDDDDHHHRPPHDDAISDRAAYLMRNRTDPATVRAEDLAPYRDEIAELPVNVTDRMPRGVQRRPPRSPSGGGFSAGGPGGGGRSIANRAIPIRRPSVDRGDRGDQWQR